MPTSVYSRRYIDGPAVSSLPRHYTTHAHKTTIRRVDADVASRRDSRSVGQNRLEHVVFIFLLVLAHILARFLFWYFPFFFSFVSCILFDDDKPIDSRDGGGNFQTASFLSDCTHRSRRLTRNDNDRTVGSRERERE